MRFRTRTILETAAVNNWFYWSMHYKLFPREIGVGADMWLNAALLVMCVEAINGHEYPPAEAPLQLIVDAPDAPGGKPRVAAVPGWYDRVPRWFHTGAKFHFLVQAYIHFERVYWTLLDQGRATDFRSTAGVS